MPGTNKYFNFHSQRSRTSEQQLLDDLLNEAVEIYGMDVYYIVRESEDEFDPLYGEDPLAYFERAYSIPMYVVDVENYRGEGEFLSKFGLETRQGANFIITSKHFKRSVPESLAIRPREGDLIWVPVFTKLFEIKFADQDKNFYQLGRRDAYFWEIYTELYKFNQNKINTRNDEIDQVNYTDASAIRFNMDVGNGNTDYIYHETLFQGATLNTATATGTLSAWSRATGNLDIIHIKGIFQSNSNIIGATSNTSYRVADHNNQKNVVFYDASDNFIIQTEANAITNFSETNPFGMP